MVKITPCQIPSNWSKNPPAKFPIPGAISALTLNAIYKTLKLVPRSTFLKIFFEKKSFWVICADKLFWKIDGFRDIINFGDFTVPKIVLQNKIIFSIRERQKIKKIPHTVLEKIIWQIISQNFCRTRLSHKELELLEYSRIPNKRPPRLFFVKKISNHPAIIRTTPLLSFLLCESNS